MTVWARAFLAAILRHRWVVLVLVGALTVVAAVYAARVTLDSSIEIWFLDDDPGLRTYHAFLDRFGADEIGVVAVLAPDVFAPEVMRTIDRITREVEQQVPYLHRVLSLTNVRVFEAADEAVEIAPLLRSLPGTDLDSRRLRESALTNPLVTGTLVSKDGRAAAVIVEMDPKGNTFEGKTRFVGALRAVVDAAPHDGMEIRIAGSPTFDAAFFQYSEHDARVFGPAALLLVVVACFLVFRSLSATLIPLSVVTVAVLWTHGIMGAIGLKINVVTMMLTALILAIGVADSVHILAEYHRQLRLGRKRDDAIVESLSRLLVPCFFTSATTVVGLLSLVVTDLAPIREFGWLASTGVTLAFLLTFTLVPAALGLARAPDASLLEERSQGLLGRLLGWLGRPTPRRSWGTLAIATALLAVALASLPELEIGANPINYFRESDPVRQDMKVVDEALGGSASVELFVKAPERGLLDPEKLRRLADLQTWLGERPAIGRTISILDALREVNRVLHDGEPAQASLPHSRNLAAQFYLLMEGEPDFEAFVQDDYSTGRITARVRMTASGQAIQQMHVLESKLEAEFSGSDLHVEATGFVKLMEKMETYLVRSQIRSFALAFAGIVLMMMALLGSVKLGLFSMIPNLVPIALGLGVMAASGVSLDPGTTMIASITLGLVVDNAIHFLHRLRHHSLAGIELTEAIRRTMEETGRPIITTGLILAGGCSILALGSFTPNVYFGLMTATVILLAVVADLVILPAILQLLQPTIALVADVEAFPKRRSQA